MSKFRHNATALLNPMFNLTYAAFQMKGIEVVSGPESSKKIGKLVKKLGLKKPLIVTDKMLIQLGLTNNMTESIAAEGIEYAIFDGILPDPSTDIVEAGSKCFIENNCDGVISFGGGSAIDASKVISGLAINPKVKNYSGLTRLQSFSMRKGTAPLIAVPTTAGTGAEVTMGAVISDSKTHQKGTVVDQKFIAKYVFLDPNLTVGLPPHVTSTTAFDALTHAIESYISKFANETSRENAKAAIKEIFTYLPQSMETPSDLVAREKLLIASNKAGFAIGRTHIGTIHAIGHNAGAMNGIPHGLIIAVLLPQMCEFLKKRCEKQFAELALLIGTGSETDSKASLADKFVKAVETLADQVNIPQSLDKLDASKNEVIAQRAEKEAYLYPVPGHMSQKEILGILTKITA